MRESSSSETVPVTHRIGFPSRVTVFPSITRLPSASSRIFTTGRSGCPSWVSTTFPRVRLLSLTKLPMGYSEIF